MKNIHQPDSEPKTDAQLEGKMIAEFDHFKILSAAEQNRVLEIFDRMIAEEAKPEVRTFLIEVKRVFAKYEKGIPGGYKNLTSESRSEILTRGSGAAEESERERISALEMLERRRAESVGNLEEMLKGGE